MARLQKLLFVPDLHAPYHSVRALELIFRVAEGIKPDTIVVLGDACDFWSISSYSKNPERTERLEAEVESVNEVLDRFDSLGARKKVYVAGNHEDRLERYLREKAPELFPFIDVQKLFKLKERGWQFVPYKRSTKIGKLHITHDVGTAGRYNVFKCLDTFQGPVLTAHTHRMATIVEGNAKGETMISCQLGWLGDINQIDYMHQIRAMRDWSLGFGVGYHDLTTHNVHLVPVPIVNFSAVVEGVLYRG